MSVCIAGQDNAYAEQSLVVQTAILSPVFTDVIVTQKEAKWQFGICVTMYVLYCREESLHTYILHVSDLAVMILGFKFNSHPVIKES